MAPLQEFWIFGASLAVFWLLVFLLNRAVPLKKYGFSVEPFFIKYESLRFKAFLERESNRNPTFWKIFSNLSVALGAGLMLFALFFLSDNLAKFLKPGEDGSPVVPVLPGVTLRLYWLPYLTAAIVLAAVTHEAAHGIIARIEGVSIRSAGAFFLAILPGGFVDLDEKELEGASTASKLRIVSVGSAVNFTVWLLLLVAVSGLFVQSPSGIVIVEVLEGGPLDRAGIGRWDVLYAINGVPIRTYQDLSIFMANVTPGDRLVISTSRGDMSIIAASDPDQSSRAIIGVRSPVLSYYPSRLGLGFFWDIHLYMTLSWMSVLLFSLSVFNMLPVPVLDGDKFLQYLTQRFTKKAKPIKTFLNAAALFLILANMTLTLGAGFSPF